VWGNKSIKIILVNSAVHYNSDCETTDHISTKPGADVLFPTAGYRIIHMHSRYGTHNNKRATQVGTREESGGVSLERRSLRCAAKIGLWTKTTT